MRFKVPGTGQAVPGREGWMHHSERFVTSGKNYVEVGNPLETRMKRGEYIGPFGFPDIGNMKAYNIFMNKLGFGHLHTIILRQN